MLKGVVYAQMWSVCCVEEASPSLYRWLRAVQGQSCYFLLPHRPPGIDGTATAEGVAHRPGQGRARAPGAPAPGGWPLWPRFGQWPAVTSWAHLSLEEIVFVTSRWASLLLALSFYLFLFFFSPCTCLYCCKHENLQVQVELG